MPGQISTLPTELVVFVVENLDRLRDFSSLARADRRLYNVVNPILYKRAAARGETWPLAWASHCGVPETLRKILAAGVDPNHQFYDTQRTDEWKHNVATLRATAAAGAGAEAGTTTSNCAVSAGLDACLDWEREEDWEEDSVGGSDTEPKWSPEVSDSDHPTTVSSHEPSSDSLQQWSQPSNNSNGSNGALTSAPPSDASDVDMVSMDGSDESEDGEGGGVMYFDLGIATVHRRFQALHLAARAGHSEIVDILLAHGAQVDAASENFCDCVPMGGLLNSAECPQAPPAPLWTPLHTAICHSHGHVAKMLLSRGASYQMEIAHSTSTTVTALHHAAAVGMSDVVSYILDNSIQTEVDIQDDRSFTPFYYAYASRQWTTTVPLLLSRGANINADTKMFIPYTTITALGEACRMGHFTEADRLIDLGADVTRGFIAQNGRGLSPVHMCCMPCARAADPTAPRIYGGEEGLGLPRMNTIAKLLRRGAILNAVDCAGDTPLMVAAQNHIVPGMRAVIKAGADLTICNALGRNAVMQAVLGPPNRTAQASHDPHGIHALGTILRELLQAGATLDGTDSDGNNVLHIIAKDSGPLREKAMRLVLNQPGVDRLMQQRNRAGHTPFLQAFYTHHIDACDILVRHGCFQPSPPVEELLIMLKFASRLTTGGGDKLMNYVLDLDVDRRLATDPTLFPTLLVGGASQALTLAQVMCTRGLPPLRAEDRTRLLFEAIQSAANVDDRTSLVEVAHALIEAGADVNAINNRGQTPISVVLDMSITALIRPLLLHGANIHFEMYRSHQPRPLTKAIQLGAEFSLDLMLRIQPLRNDLRALGGHYLHEAVRFGKDRIGQVLPPKEKIINALLASGASITELDREGNMPLAVLLKALCLPEHRCFTWRFHRYIKALLGPGVNVNHKNNEGRCVADYLQELMEPKYPHNEVDTAFLAKRVKVTGSAAGLRMVHFLEKPRKRVRPAAVISV